MATFSDALKVISIVLQELCINCILMEDLLEKLINDKCWLILMMSGGDFAAAVFHKFVFTLQTILPHQLPSIIFPIKSVHIANNLRNPTDIHFHLGLFSASRD